MRRTTPLFIAGAILLVLLFAADIAVGSVSLSITEVIRSLVGGDVAPEVRSIVLDIRLIRAVMAILAGAALSVSGLQMQTLFRNPMAGPFILGVSSGASLGVALFLLGAPVLGIAGHSALQSIGITGAAWLGSALVLGIIATLGRRIKDIMVILILGMMIGSGISSLVETLQYLGEESALKSFVIWNMGSLGEVTLTQMKTLAPIVIGGLVLSIATIKPLNILLLGEHYARTSGMHIERTRLLIFFSTILLAGTITAFCGPIGFVGLAVPHLARMIFRSADHTILIPASMILGAILMLVGDIVAKLLTMPINTITALMGIPVVIFVVMRNRKLL